MASPADRAVPLRLWVVLTEASVAGALAVLPYLLTARREDVARANARRLAEGKRPVGLPLLLALTALQGQFTFGLPAWLGLRVGRPLGLGAPRLEAWLSGRPAGPSARLAGRAGAAGAGVALLTAAVDLTLFQPARERFRARGVREPGVWQGLLASLYGAVAEEVLLRLGLQTLLAAGLRALRGDTTTRPDGATMWPAIVLANVAFGAGHLPTTRALVGLSPLIVTRALVLNAVPGILFGYLYWHEGLEAAMLAHGTADLVLHAGGTLLPAARE